MAFLGNHGASISFDSFALMDELRSDIGAYGGNILLYVISEDLDGVTIYKDYFFDDPIENVRIKPGEEVRNITAGELYQIYKEQNNLF